jgi:hypothetical protein
MSEKYFDFDDFKQTEISISQLIPQIVSIFLLQQIFSLQVDFEGKILMKMRSF